MNWQADGQKKLDEALTETEAFLANRDWMPPAPPVGLLAWLKHNKTILKNVHAPECKRRGLSMAGSKAVFKGTDGKNYDARPVGYVGELPVSASLCCACKAASCVAAAAAADAAAAVAPLAPAEATTDAAAVDAAAVDAAAAATGAATGAAAAEADMSD